MSLLLALGCESEPEVLTEDEFISVIAGPTGDECQRSGECTCGPEAVWPECPAAACFTVSCVSGGCLYEPIEGCTRCGGDSDCDDGSMCTLDACVAGACVHTDDPCDDGQPCTGTTCDPEIGCVYEDVCDPPVITLASTAEVEEGSPLATFGSFTGAPGETFSATVDWDVADDEEPVPLALNGNAFTLDHVYPDNGTHQALVVITDGAERSSDATLAVQVTNVAPQVEGLPQSAESAEGEELVLTGAVEEVPADTISLRIVYGDGESETLLPDKPGEFEIRHVYRNDGSYIIEITASDEDGGQDQRSVSVEVSDVAPIISGPTEVESGEGGFDLFTYEVVDPGADVFTGTLDLGLGGEPETLTIDPGTREFQVAFDYANEAVEPFTATLNVTDADGIGAELSVAVLVTNVAPSIEVPKTQLADEGVPLSLDAVFADPGDDPFSATVSWGDGSEESVGVDAATRTIPLVHTYADDGSYQATLTVTDGVSADEQSFQVEVANVAPVPNLGGLIPADEGTPWQHQGQVTDLGLLDALSAQVTWTAGEQDITQNLSLDAERGYTLERTFPNQGEVQVTLYVVDEDGGEGSETQTLTVNNVAPSAIDCGVPIVVNEAVSVTRTCTFVDPGDDTWSATINYGDGGDTATLLVDQEAQSFSFTHAWAVQGTFQLEVRVSDGDSAPVPHLLDVIIGDAPPLILLSNDELAVDEGTPLEILGQVLDATISDSFQATVDYGDGSGVDSFTITPSRTFALTHTYADEGTGRYKLKLTVTDADGETGTLEHDVLVSNVAPEIHTGLELGEVITLNEGERLTRTVTLSDAGSRDSLSATVDYGDGDGPSNAVVDGDGQVSLNHVYTRSGEFEVRIVARDSDQGSSTGGLQVQVDNTPPTITPGAATTIPEGTLFSRSIGLFDAGADPLRVTVDWGDGSSPTILSSVTAASVSVSHTYADNGVFTVSVSADDGDDITRASFSINVTNVAPVIIAADPPAGTEGSLWSHQIQVTDAGSDTFTGRVRWEATGTFEPVTVDASGVLVLSHTFPLRGTYSVTVEVTDDDGAVATQNLSAQISNVTPVISIANIPSVLEGELWEAQATFTDPGEQTVWSGTIDYGDDEPTEQVNFDSTRVIPLSHTWASKGSYDVTITVNDGAAIGTSEFSVQVDNQPPAVSGADSGMVYEGAEFTRTLTLDDPGGDPLTVTVDWGDGDDEVIGPTNDVSVPISHVYVDDGNFTVAITVDDGSAQIPAELEVEVLNAVPTIDPGEDYPESIEAQSWQHTVELDDAGANDTFVLGRVQWSAGGTWDTVSVSGPGELALDHTFAAAGVYDVTVEITDDDGGVGSVTFPVEVENVAPVITQVPSAQSVGEGEAWTGTVTFTDPGVPAEWIATIDYGDGEVSEQLSVGTERTFQLSRTWDDNGVYIVALTVSDGIDSDAKYFLVTVGNTPPQIDYSTPPPPSVDEGAPWGHRVYLDDDGPLDTYVMARARWGDDGVQFENLSISGRPEYFDVGHTWALRGTYDVTLEIADNGGAVGSVTFPVVIQNVAPVVSAPTAPLTSDEGSMWQATGSFVDPGDQEHWQGTIDYGDGRVDQVLLDELREIPFSHEYADEGSYTVEATVGDGEDNHTVSFTVDVANVAPAVEAGDDAQIEEGGTFSRTIELSDPGDDELTVTVQWGDGSDDTVIGPTADASVLIEHQFLTKGSYTVTVTADDQLAQGMDTFDVSVVKLTAPASASVDEGTLWETTVTFEDPAPSPNPWQVEIDYDDGSENDTLTLSSGETDIPLSHTWADEGAEPFEVEVTVTDSVTANAVMATIPVTVNNVAPAVTAPGDMIIDLNVAFSAPFTFTDPGVNDPLTLEIDFGDGSGEVIHSIGTAREFDLMNLPNPHRYDATGSYLVQVEASDGDGGEQIDNFTVTVTNSVPVVSAPDTVPTANEGEAWLAVASFEDPDNESYWTASINYGDGTGFFPLFPSQNKNINMIHTWRDEGTYTVQVEVTDTAPQTGVVEFDVTVANVPPVVTFDNETVSADEGSSVSVSGTAKETGTNDDLTATIDWGDGGGPQNLVINPMGVFNALHTYADDDDYTVTVTVDDGTTQVVETATAQIANVAPQINPPPGVQVEVLRTQTFDITWTDPGADTWDWEIDWGDGSPTEGGTGLTDRNATVSHAFSTLGEHIVTMTVTDDEGGQDIEQVTFTAVNAQPLIVLPYGSISVDEGETLNLVAAIDDPHPVAQTHVATARWDAGESVVCDDGDTTPPGGNWTCSTTGKPPDASLTVDDDNDLIIASNIYRLEGQRHLQLWVTDSDGSTSPAGGGCDSQQGCLKVNVQNVAPTIAPGVSAVASYDTDLQLLATIEIDDPGIEFSGAQPWPQNPGSGIIQTVDWDATDGLLQAQNINVMGTADNYYVELNHIYPAEGIYTITITVNDGGGPVVKQIDAHIAKNTCDGRAATAIWDRIWMGIDGTDATDWSQPNNWWPIGVPATDEAVALCHPEGTSFNEVNITEDTEVGAIYGSDYFQIKALDHNVTLTANGDVLMSDPGGFTGTYAEGSTLVLAGTGSYSGNQNDWATVVTGDITVLTEGKTLIANDLTVTEGIVRNEATNMRVSDTFTTAISQDGSTGFRMAASNAELTIGNDGAFIATANTGATTATSAGHWDQGAIRLWSGATFTQDTPEGLTGATFVAGPDLQLRLQDNATVHFDSPGLGATESCLGAVMFDGSVDRIATATSNLCVQGEITNLSDSVLTPSTTGLELLAAGSGGLNIGVGAVASTLDLGDMDVRIEGAWQFATTLTTTGDLTVQNGGSVVMRNGTLRVGSATFTQEDGGFPDCAPAAPEDCILEMRNDNAVIEVAGDMSMTVVSPPADLGWAEKGRFIIGGNLTTSGGTVHMMGTHEIELTGSGTHTVELEGGDPYNLRLSGNGTLDLATFPINVMSELRDDDPARFTVTGSHDLNTGGLDVVGLVIDGVRFMASLQPGGTFTMDDVIFRNTDPTLSAFSINGSEAIVATRLQFEVVPTSGYYIEAGGSLTLDVFQSLPGYGGDFVLENDTATVNWGSATSDGDGDGLIDDDELTTHLTNPGLVDTDGDGVGDGAEVSLGTDPTDDTDAPFSMGVPIPFGYDGTDPIALALADVFGQTHRDVVIADGAADKVYIYESDGTGGVNNMAEEVDLNGTPRDMVATSGTIYVSHTNRVYEVTEDQGGNWVETEVSPLSDGYEPGPLVLAPDDEDMAPVRILTAFTPSSGTVQCRAGPVSDTCIASMALGVGPTEYYDAGGTVGTFALGSGVFRPGPATTPKPGFVDLNPTRTGVWAGDPGGGLPFQRIANIEVFDPAALAVRDIDGADTSEFVVSSRVGSASGPNEIHVRKQGGTWTNMPTVWKNTFPVHQIVDLEIMDINDDDLPDIIGVSPDVDGLAVWIQDDSNNFFLSIFPANVGVGATLVEVGHIGPTNPCAVSVHPEAGVFVIWCPPAI